MHKRYAEFDTESADGTAAQNISSSCLPKPIRYTLHSGVTEHPARDTPARLFFSKRQAGAKKISRAKKVEPKTLFANERTYLQWMQAGVLLTTLSLGLLSLEGDSSKAGYFMAPIAVLVMAWSTLRCMPPPPPPVLRVRAAFTPPPLPPTFFRYYIRAKAIAQNQAEGYFGALYEL